MQIKEIFSCSVEKACELPLFDTKVQAGYPSPADGYMSNSLDLNSHLIKHPKSTFFVQVTGDSMIDAGIRENDLLIVDKLICQHFSGQLFMHIFVFLHIELVIDSH
ncbi:MAG TPA: hypothetical protein LFV91_07115 [Rickettsia endosymbiont of Bembidion nr. Transversale]|nr:hypothetical protein [Rickettsia endosymbiont of Bembidion nr. Transversale]